jgi:PKD repeat protein
MILQIITAPTADFNFTQTDFCKPSSIQFFDASSSNASTRLWVFEGGNPSTSSETNPIVQYNTVGDFNVKLTVSNSLYSDSKELLDTVHIRTKPTPDFNYTIVGNTVNFINSSQNAISYLWNFGDNTTSTETNPVHVFAGGSYQVSLKAINDCGDSIRIKTIAITLEPVAAFSAEEISGCSPFSTTFHNNSNTTNISWVFEGGLPATSTQQNPVVNYLNSGQFDVTIYATNALGIDTLFMNNYIQVLAQPTGAFSKSVNGYTASFTQTTNNVTGFYWDFGDGSAQSTQVNPSHTYQNDGIYTVQFVYYNDCDTLTYSNSIAIANPPVANFTYSNPTGCSPLTVTFTNASSSNSALYNWTFEGGTPATSTAQNPVVAFNNKGTFNVSLTVTNSQGNNTKAIEDLVTVNSKPVPNFSKTNVGLNYTFSYTGETASQVKWHFGDGTSAIGQQVNHTYSSAGTYGLKVIGTNSCGSDTLVQSLVVTLNPTANFTYNTHQGCAPLVVQYTNTSSSANSVFWLFEGGIPSFSIDNNPQVTYTVGGNFDVQLIAFGNSSNDTLIMESIINVNDGPTVYFNYTVTGATANFTNLSSAEALTYFWDFGDGNVSELKNPTHTYAANGNYNVSLFANNQCGTKSLTKVVLITTVKTNELNLEKLVLYPNPNDGIFSLEFDSPESGNYNFRVFSSTGQKVAEIRKSLSEGSNKIDFQLHDIPVGLYLLKAEKDGKFYNILFSKQ